MCPSTSAYTKFCAGTTKWRSAAVKSFQFLASLSFRNARIVESSSSSAVHRNASGSRGWGLIATVEMQVVDAFPEMR